MGLVSLVLELETGEAERLGDALLDAGALSVSAEDPLAGTPAEVPLYDEPGWREHGHTPGWPLLRLRVLIDEHSLPQGQDAGQMLAMAARGAGLADTPPFECEPLTEQDWVTQTQAQSGPIQISERLWIVPSWHVAPDPHAVNIALDPGIAFGTGSHPTTRLCLRWLEAHIQGGESVLDYGCGSGILAIAAALLGAGRVIGIDIDKAAVSAARDNAGRNGVSAVFADTRTELKEQADLVVANILANPLKVLAPLLARLTRCGGHLALSGVLASQAAEVMAVYGPWFAFGRCEQDEDWVCLSAIRLSTARLHG